MNYFLYEIPEQEKRFLIGTDKNQIINGMEFIRDNYRANVSIPSDSDIKETLKLNIGCSFKPLNPDQHLEVEIRDNVTFDVYANSFYYIRWLSENSEKMKRGDLFKFDTGMAAWGIYFLPEYIMQGLREYDWDQHNKQLWEWLKEGPNNGAKTLRGRL